MADTPRSTSYLTTTTFVGGSPGAINSQSMRDLVVSGPQWDDPSNTSGLGAPAILRGTVSTYNLSGLTIGSGMSTGVRQANATALNNALSYAATSGKFFELDPGTYEISSATGLLIPAQGFNAYTMTWRGAPNALIEQFATNAPILTIGDTTATTPSVGLDIHGATLRYGSSQTGQTGAVALKMGYSVWGRIGGLFVSDTTNPAYIGIQESALGFSMTYTNISVGQCQQNILDFEATATQSVWQNIYLNNGGSGVYNSLGGSYLYFATNYDGVFECLNCEWGACAAVLQADFAAAHISFSGLHIEGIKMAGSFPCLFLTAGGLIRIENMTIVDVVVQSGNISGNAILFEDYTGFPSVITLSDFVWTANTAGLITAPFTLFQQTTQHDDNASVFTCKSGALQDQTATNIFSGNFLFDPHTPTASFVAPAKWGEYTWGSAASRIDRAVITVSSTYTHYGQHERSDIFVPASITGFTITLAATMGATGTLAVRTGNTVHIRRQGGSASGTLLVKDDAGTTLTTSTTSATDYWYVFNGTHYVTVTPVS